MIQFWHPNRANLPLSLGEERLDLLLPFAVKMTAKIGDTVVALFDFQGASAEVSCCASTCPGVHSTLSQDLPFVRSDELKIVSISGDSNWWLADHLKTKKRGMIPANYVVCHHQQTLPGCLATLDGRFLLAQQLKQATPRKDTTLPRDKQGVPEGVSCHALARLLKASIMAVQPMPWFHGKIKRTLADAMLQNKPKGTYLVRESTNFPGDYTLSLMYAWGRVPSESW